MIVPNYIVYMLLKLVCGRSLERFVGNGSRSPKIMSTCKLSIMGILVIAQKARMPVGIQRVKDRLRRFVLEPGTPPSIGLETDIITSGRNIVFFFSFPEILLQTDFKGSGLIHLAEKISKQPSTHTMA